MKQTPLVSCICPTYNRAPDYLHLIEEAIESFLRQDYPNKELIVLNDTPGQELFYDAEGVSVINVPRRFRTLGEKSNAAVAMAKGDIIAPWDDDDISLPWRLSLSIQRLGDADYFNPRSYWRWEDGRLHHDHYVGFAHNASVYTRKAFVQIHGYRLISLGIDRDMDYAFVTRLERGVDSDHRGSPALSMSEWVYVYRWGVSPLHVSSELNGDIGQYGAIGIRPIEPGPIQLKPHWQTDWVEETRTYLKSIGEPVENFTEALR